MSSDMMSLKTTSRIQIVDTKNKKVECDTVSRLKL